MDNLPLLATGVTLLACVLAVLGVHAFSSGKAQQHVLYQRMAQTDEMPVVGRRRPFRGLDRRLRRTRLGKRIERKLHTTGLHVTPGEYVVYVVAGVLGVYFVISSVFAPFFGLLAALLALWCGNFFLNYQIARRTEAFINQLPELTRVLANATQAGLALRTAIAMAAEELDDPASEEFRKVADQLAVGRSLEEALADLGERLPSRELKVLVSTLVLSNRAGGAIVSSLRNLTETLEERKETRREIRTQLSQVTMTSYAVPALGVGALFLMNGVRDGALARMTGSPVGQLCVLVAFALYAVGFVLIRRLSRIDV